MTVGLEKVEKNKRVRKRRVMWQGRKVKRQRNKGGDDEMENVGMEVMVTTRGDTKDATRVRRQRKKGGEEEMEGMMMTRAMSLETMK